MVYMGSKNKLSKDLVPIIQSYIANNNIENYLEPFVGGGNLIDKVVCKYKYGSDVNKYLIALLKQAQKDIKIFPSEITKEEYNRVKDNKNNYDDWYVGLVGFCASYKGKFFNGYAKETLTKNGTIRNYTKELINNLIKQSINFKDIEFNCCDYTQINSSLHNFLIYCDPPYRDTTKYKIDEFDYENFYNWCVRMSENNIVLISEYDMPQDRFECIWSKEMLTTLNNNRDNANRIEKLFICKK